MSNFIDDWQKAAIIALSPKYGRRATGKRIGVSAMTVKRYQDIAKEEGHIEMDGTNLEVKNES